MKADPFDRYCEEMGHLPPAPGDHPLAHQWDYRGTRVERSALREELLGVGEEEPVPFIEGQESLL